MSNIWVSNFIYCCSFLLPEHSYIQDVFAGAKQIVESTSLLQVKSIGTVL